jgi:hypothetical protein
MIDCVAIPGELYTVTLNNVSNIYVEHTEGGWEAWRERHFPNPRKPMNSKIIATGNTFDFVLLKMS